MWVLLVGLTGVPAAAQGRRVAVVSLGLDAQGPGEAERLAYFAEQAALRSNRFEVVRLVNALDVTQAGARERALKDAQAAMQLGQRAYDELDTQKALAQFERAIKGFEQTDLTRNFKSLSGAWVMKIASLVANGENKAAELEIDKLMAVDPQAQFPANYFPPEFLSYAEKSRRAYGGGGNIKLLVTTQPAGAQVYVDGRFRGISPFTATGLSSAEHYVTVIAGGYSLAQQRALLGPVEFTLKKAEDAVGYLRAVEGMGRARDGQMRDEGAAKLGRALGVEEVLLVESRKTGNVVDVTAVRVDSADGRKWGEDKRELALKDSFPQDADDLFTKLLGKDEPSGAGTSRSEGWNRKKTGYVLMGVGAALVATGVYFGITALGKQESYRRLQQTGSQENAIADQGKAAALASDLFNIAGLLTAGTGAYLSFFSGSNEPSTEVREEGRSAFWGPSLARLPSASEPRWEDR